MAKAVAPAACASFENNRLKAVRFSGEEMAELRRRLEAAEGASPKNEAPEGPGLSGKRLERFEEKLRTGKQL